MCALTRGNDQPPLISCYLHTVIGVCSLYTEFCVWEFKSRMTDVGLSANRIIQFPPSLCAVSTWTARHTSRRLSHVLVFLCRIARSCRSAYSNQDIFSRLSRCHLIPIATYYRSYLYSTLVRFYASACLYRQMRQYAIGWWCLSVILWCCAWYPSYLRNGCS